MDGQGFPLPHGDTEFAGDPLGGDAGMVDLIAAEADGAHAGVTSAAEALADFGEIDQLFRRKRRPGIGANRDFGAEAGTRDGDGVRSLRIEEVRNELAESLGFAVEQIEEDDTILEDGALTDKVDGGAMLFEQRLDALLDKR